MFLLTDVSGISPSFPGVFRPEGYVPTCYSPVCRSPCGALDLHVLGLPPAFVLSHDQTLKLNLASLYKRPLSFAGVSVAGNGKSLFEGSSYSTLSGLTRKDTFQFYL